MLRRWRWTVLALLCLSTAINYIDRQALAVVLPTLRSDLGMSSADYGRITTVFLVAYTAAQVAFGLFIDRVGTRLGLSLAIVIWSLAAIGHAWVEGVASLLVLRLLLGIGEAGNWPAGTKAVAEWFPRSERAFAMGLFDGGSAMGAVIAPPLVAALTLAYGWRAAFIATGLLGLVWLVAWLWLYHPALRHPRLSAEDREIAAKELEVAAGPPRRVPMGQLLAQTKLWGLMATRMIATPVWWFYVFWLPDYLAKGRGFSLKEIGMFGWMPFFTVDLGKIVGGKLSDRLIASGWSATLARKSVMAGGAAAMMGGIPVAAADTAGAALAWVCLATFGFGMWSANILALHADLFPAEAMATATGLTGTAASLGGAAFTYAVGAMVDRSGYEPVFLAVGTAALFALASLVFWVGRVERIRIAHGTA